PFENELQDVNKTKLVLYVLQAICNCKEEDRKGTDGRRMLLPARPVPLASVHVSWFGGIYLLLSGGNFLNIFSTALSSVFSFFSGFFESVSVAEPRKINCLFAVS